MRVVKTMALTEKAFLETLPRALDSDAYTWDGERAVLARDGRVLSVTFRPQPVACLGGFRIPRADETLDFAGYSEADAEAALARFERYFHRGGG
ncbi:MAG: hypothetical protein HQL36_09250 [Alphaproteobacteria bacterium]|nr:hypothetical protein [Alphaproteobacteria bacterium]